MVIAAADWALRSTVSGRWSRAIAGHMALVITLEAARGRQSLIFCKVPYQELWTFHAPQYCALLGCQLSLVSHQLTEIHVIGIDRRELKLGGEFGDETGV